LELGFRADYESLMLFDDGCGFSLFPSHWEAVITYITCVTCKYLWIKRALNDVKRQSFSKLDFSMSRCLDGYAACGAPRKVKPHFKLLGMMSTINKKISDFGHMWGNELFFALCNGFWPDRDGRGE
jgi:hypothetical protein